MQIVNLPAIRPQQPAWNKGRIVGQKRPLLPKHGDRPVCALFRGQRLPCYAQV